VPTWLHPLVQDPHNFDEVWPNDAIVQDMYGPPHLGFDVRTDVPQMKAPNSVGEFATLARSGAVRFCRHLADACGEHRCVAAPRLEFPTVQHLQREFLPCPPAPAARGDGLPFMSARMFVRRPRQTFEVAIKIGIGHFQKISSIECIDPVVDSRP